MQYVRQAIQGRRPTLAATTAVSALQLLKLNRYCGQAEAIHLDEKRRSLPDKCRNQRLDATDSSPTPSDNRGGFPNRRAAWTP
jgi:hypothetical protein